MRMKGQLETQVRERTLELEASREHLRIQANQDSLTQLPNRPAILSRLNREVARALHENSPLTIVLVDIDHFKSINDTFGHLAGDEALRSFAAALSGCIRFTDCAGRYGGEEFLVLLTDVPAPDLDQRLAHLHRGISNLTVRYEEVEFRINCSLGAVSFSPSDHDVSHILAAADHALYQAKKAGRNRVVHHEALKTETAA
jgi:diguanylate cyclase (GGDEF)-like protein